MNFDVVMVNLLKRPVLSRQPTASLFGGIHRFDAGVDSSAPACVVDCFGKACDHGHATPTQGFAGIAPRADAGSVSLKNETVIRPRFAFLR